HESRPDQKIRSSALPWSRRNPAGQQRLEQTRKRDGEQCRAFFKMIPDAFILRTSGVPHFRLTEPVHYAIGRTRDVDNFTSTAGADSAAALASATLELAVTSPGNEPTSWCAPSSIDFGYLAEMPPPLAAPSNF